MSSKTSSDAPGAAALTALLAGAALGGFDAGAIGYVLPAMRAATGADAQAASALVSVFVAGTLVAIAGSGFAAAHAGALRLFGACAALAAAGAALAAAAPGYGALLLARVLQGLAQGPLLPLAATVIALRWPAHRQGRLIGALSLVYGLAFLVAMVATPWLLHVAGWRAAFVVSLVLAMATLLAWLLARGGPPTDMPAAPVGHRLAGALALRSREMAAVALLSIGTGVAQAALLWFPTLAMARLAVPAAETSLLMLPMVAGGIGTTLAITALLDRVGARRLLIGGAAATLAGVLLAVAAPASRLLFMLGVGLLGVGITGLSGGPLRYAASRAVPAQGQSLAQSAVALLTNVGVLGASVLVGALAARPGDERANIEYSLLAACALMAAVFWPVFALRAHGAPSPPPVMRRAGDAGDRR